MAPVPKTPTPGNIVGFKRLKQVSENWISITSFFLIHYFKSTFKLSDSVIILRTITEKPLLLVEFLILMKGSWPWKELPTFQHNLIYYFQFELADYTLTLEVCNEIEKAVNWFSSIIR